MKNMRNSSRGHLVQSLNPKPCPSEELFRWLALPRYPVLASENPLVNRFIESMFEGEPVDFIYIGGTKPGSPRKVIVSLVFQHEPADGIYIAGYCLERRANRIFRLDLIMTFVAWN